jgi:hypothetical protein
VGLEYPPAEITPCVLHKGNWIKLIARITLLVYKSSAVQILIIPANEAGETILQDIKNEA